MGWKNGLYWLKGGIVIGLPLLLISFYVSISRLKCLGVGNLSTCGLPLGNFFGIIYNFILFPFTEIFDIRFITGSIVFRMVIFFTYFFVIGAIIGWIYGKIKSRKSVSE